MSKGSKVEERMTTMSRSNFEEVPKFVQLIEARDEDYNAKVIKEIIAEVFAVAVKRGLTDEEFSMLLRLFYKRSLSISNKLNLLRSLVPKKKVPKTAIEQFLVWFISNLVENTFSRTTSQRILQWIIGLLEHNLVESKEINNFYFEFFNMLAIPNLIPYVAKLLYKLTKRDDVNSQTIMAVLQSPIDLKNKYILALLNVFQDYKPHLFSEKIKKVNVVKVFASVSHSMDSVMNVRVIHSQPLQFPTTSSGVSSGSQNPSYFGDESNRTSSLIPLPTYNLEGMGKWEAFYPRSVEEAFKNFNSVPVPQNIMSFLKDDAGFFMISNLGIEEQKRFLTRLLQTLQNALIYKESKPSDEDVEFLFRRVYSLQAFMVQGVHSVTLFLSGYLMNWDGLEHRSSILKLIEFVTFHSFKELANSILRPLHILFVTNDAKMKREIIQTLVKLIRHMFVDAVRTRQGLPYPFMGQCPKWTKEESLGMLQSLVNWTEELIMLGLECEQDSTDLLMESLQFYESINSFEVTSCSPMFTVVSERILLKSLLSQQPATIMRICRLLLRYHQEILPQLRLKQPDFYESCKDKISLTSNYAQQVMYFLQNGEVKPPRKENTGLTIREVSIEKSVFEGESSFLTNHTCFLSTVVPLESYKNGLNLLIPGERKAAFEFAYAHLKYITNFMKYFSAPQIPEVSNG